MVPQTYGAGYRISTAAGEFLEIFALPMRPSRRERGSPAGIVIVWNPFGKVSMC
jgi:hypothetical protein